jgi:hypothetical protein
MKILIFSFLIIVLSGCTPEKITYYKINSSRNLNLLTSTVGEIKQGSHRSILVNKYDTHTKSILDSNSKLSILISDTYYNDIKSIYKRTCKKNDLILNIKDSRVFPIKATVDLRNTLENDSTILCLYQFNITLNNLNEFDVVLDKKTYGNTPKIEFKKVIKNMVIYAPQS